MKSSILSPQAYTDHRGVIRSWPIDQPILEYNLMETRDGTFRGFHYHPHFDEYMLVVHGTCEFTEFSDDGDHHRVRLGVGDSIRIPANTSHAFRAIGDFRFVSMLTRRWDDSDPPIVKVDDDGKPV
jgi:mannose-6-phosphate isomerase-like protein (cupin superfamily)